jgi:hypothetical protein
MKLKNDPDYFPNREIVTKFAKDYSGNLYDFQNTMVVIRWPNYTIFVRKDDTYESLLEKLKMCPQCSPATK